MKKVLSLLCGSLVIFLMFFVPGNPVQAAETEDCTCHDVTYLSGAEKNKIISDLLKSDAFKAAKKELINGNTWNGVNDTQVIKINIDDTLFIGVPLVDAYEMAVFMNGIYMRNTPF